MATTSTGAVVGSTGFSYGAFGGRRDPASGSAPSAATLSADRAATHRGFTNHEMLDNLNLVHMNGRVYDPTLGRFLSVDPVFQFPTNTQSLNPYSYVLNNPLSLTDPTGYADKCPPGQTCGGAAPKQQQTQKSQGYGGHGGESSRIAEGKQSGAGMQFSKAVRAVGQLAHQASGALGEALTGLYKGLVENGAKFLQGLNDAQNKSTDTAGINAPAQINKQLSEKSTDAIENSDGIDDPKAFEKQILDASAKNNIDPNILVGLGFKESSLDPSKPGGGLFQIQAMQKPLGLSDADIKDPGKQINAVAGAIAENLKNFRGNTDLAIAAWTLGIPHTEALFAKGGMDAVRNALLNKNHPEEGRVGPQYVDKIKEFQGSLGGH